MKNKKKKIVIRVQSFYNLILTFILFIAYILLIVYSNIFLEGGKVERILFNCLLCASTFAILLLLINYIQIAIISEKGIIIKNLYHIIGMIYWNDISSVCIEKIIITSRVVVSCFWIVIRTDEGQVVFDGAINKRNKPPWQIISTKKNISIIKAALKEYRPDINIEVYDSYR